MLRDSVVVVVVRTRLRAIPLAMITMRKSTHGFHFVFHTWVAYGAPLGGRSNLVPRAHVPFGQQQDTELWNQYFRTFGFTAHAWLRLYGVKR